MNTVMEHDQQVPPQPASKSGVSIRRATPSDARALAEIHVRAWQAAYRGLLPDSLLDNLSIDEREAGWHRRLAEPEHHILVCELEGKVIGWVVYGPHRDADVDPQRVGEIYGIYLHPDAWHQGHGAALMRRAKAELGGQGLVEATLWVLRGNQRAIRFYEAHGFRSDGGAKVVVRPDGVELDEVRYRCMLA